MRTFRGFLMISLALGLVLGLGIQSAGAYVSFGSWSSSTVGFTAGSSLPSSFRPGTKFGAQQWNNVSSSSWTFFQQSGSSNQVAYGSIDGSLGIVAQATIYFNFSGTIIEADVKYDSAENWYTGPGTPGPSQVDLESVATHELGHTLGLDHTQNSHCPGNSSDATMCPTVYLGTTWLRSLEQDDRDGVSALYPSLEAAGTAVGMKDSAAFRATYAGLSQRQLVDASGAMVVGKVVAFGPTRWNGAGGAYWGSAALPYHQVVVKVSRGIAGVSGADGRVVLTVLGASPAGTSAAAGLRVSGRPDHDLTKGDRVLVLATEASMPWQGDGSRQILRFAGAPTASYARVGTEAYAKLLRLALAG